jgi:hypothetical protein
MRQRAVVKRTVGGYEVSTTKLSPTTALKLAPKLLKILLPAMRLQGGWMLVLRALAAANSDDAQSVDMGAAMGAIAGVMTELLGAIDDATLDMLYRELLADTSIIVPDEKDTLINVELNTTEMIDLAFGGLDNGLTLLVQVLLFVGEVNFKRSFFDLAAQSGLKRKTPETQASE